MPESLEIPTLARAFQWRPGPIWDPVPEWLFSHLDKRAVIDLAKIQLDLGINVLKAQVDAAEKVQALLGRTK